MLNFEINITKKVEITKLINGSIGNNWTFHWYACRDKDCSENDHSFYMVDGLFVDTNQEVWTHNPFAEYKFLEINPPNEPFYIWVAVNKNDGSEICFYFAEIRIFGSPCNDKIKLELLNCLEPGIENEEIIGKLCTTRTNLKAIQLNVSNNSVISFNREDENNRNSVIVNLSNIPTITDSCCSNYPLCYQFQVKINTTENGGYGRIEFTLIDDEDKEIEGCFPIYEFFIDPIFIPQIECRSNINELLCHNTNLPVCRCVNDVRIDRDDYFISSTLNISLFAPILHKLRFVYSIGIFTNDGETICFENNNFCPQNNTFELENYHSQAGWTLKLPGCTTETISHNSTIPNLNEFRVIHNIKGKDLVFGNDNRTTFRFDIPRNILDTLNEQFKQVNYLVRLVVERIDFDIMCPNDDICRVIENGSCCCDPYMPPRPFVDGYCPCQCPPGVLCLCPDGTTCDSHPDCDCHKCFCPSSTINSGMIVNCDEIETECNRLTVCRIFCDNFLIATLPSNPYPTEQQIKNILNDSRCQNPNAIIRIECPNGDCRRICNCCDELTFIPYNCLETIPNCPNCPPCLCECPPESNNPGLQVPCNNMSECDASEFKLCDCNEICPPGFELRKIGSDCGRNIPVGMPCNCNCHCVPEGCNECLARDISTNIDYYWEKCCDIEPLNYRDPKKGMCLNHYLNNCDGECEEEFGCISCGENFKFPITNGIGIFDIDREVDFSEVFKHYSRTICDNIETRCIIDMPKLSESLMAAMGIYYDLSLGKNNRDGTYTINTTHLTNNNETIQKQRIEPNAGLNAVYFDNGVIKNDYKYLAPVVRNNGFGYIYDELFDFRGINFWNDIDIRDGHGIINQNIFRPYWQFNGGEELEKCNFDCPSLYSDRWLEFLSNYQDIIEVNNINNTDFEDWMVNSSILGNLGALKQFVYDKLRDKINECLVENVKPNLEWYADNNCPNPKPGDTFGIIPDNEIYEKICKSLNTKCNIHSKVITYTSDYDIEDGYIQFENSPHLSGNERINGWDETLDICNKIIISLDDIPIEGLEFGNRYELCETSPPRYRVLDTTNSCDLELSQIIIPLTDIKIKFKPDNNDIILEINVIIRDISDNVIENVTKEIIISKNSNKTIKIKRISDFPTGSSSEWNILIGFQNNGIVTFNVNSINLISRFIWQNKETWECDFNRKHIRAENQQLINVTICNNVSNTWTPIDDIRTIRPFSMLSKITHYTTIPDYTLTFENNMNGLQEWATHPILAARVFKCMYNDCVELGKINPNETSIYQYLIMLYLTGCDPCDNNTDPPIENRKDGILLKVFKLNEQRRYIKNLKEKFEEYMLQFDKFNENCECRYSENINIHLPETSIIYSDSWESYDYWCWNTYHNCDRQGFDTTCGCITCPETVKGDYNHTIQSNGYRNGIISTLFDEVATLNKCGKDCNNDAERNDCHRCCDCITDIALPLGSVSPNDRKFGGINEALFVEKCECDCITGEGFKCNCQKLCKNSCPQCVDWCDAEIETPIWQTGDINGQYGPCWKLCKCEDEDGTWVTCNEVCPQCSIEILPCPFSCSDFLSIIGNTLTNIFDQLNQLNETDLVDCTTEPIPSIISQLNTIPGFVTNCNSSDFSNIGEFKEKIYDFIEYMTGNRNCGGFYV